MVAYHAVTASEPSSTSPLASARLEDGTRIACVREREVPTMSRAVEGYFAHGIELRPGDTVVDVGANIGLFTLAAFRRCGGDVRILAFEPIPPIFRALEENVRGLGSTTVHPMRCGIGREAGEVVFAFHPNQTGFSSARPEEMRGLKQELREAYLRNLAVAPAPVRWLRWLPGFLRGRILDRLMRDTFATQDFTCRVRTLSEVVREQGIDSIDLLKVDVEASELEVLQGIEEADWPRVRQVVMELNDTDSRKDRIVSLLESHGLGRIVLEQEPILAGTHIYTLFARRDAE